MDESRITVPLTRLSPEALDGLVEEYVTRDGTNLANAETKMAQVRRQLERGEVVITFDPEAGTTNIVAASDLS